MEDLISSNPISSNPILSSKKCTCPISSIFFFFFFFFYQDDEFINSVIALVFVPPTFVRVAWRGLKGEAPAFHNRDQFLEYFQDNWIEGNYPLCMLNMYSLDGPRTNNNTEGWHSKIRKLAGKAHPNIYKLAAC